MGTFDQSFSTCPSEQYGFIGCASTDALSDKYLHPSQIIKIMIKDLAFFMVRRVEYSMIWSPRKPLKLTSFTLGTLWWPTLFRKSKEEYLQDTFEMILLMKKMGLLVPEISKN